MCSSTLWQFTEQVTDNIMLTFSFILSLFQAFIFQFFCTFTPSMTLPSTDNTRSWEFTLYLEMTVVNLIFGWKRRWLLHSFLYFDKDSFISPSIIVQIDKTVNKYTSSNQGRHYYTWRQRRLGTYVWKSCAGRQSYLTIFTLQSAIWWTFPHICIPSSRTIMPSLFIE